ncbi:hypothetical protein V6Z11_D06G170700 [Gossypium hirsutum]
MVSFPTNHFPLPHPFHICIFTETIFLLSTPKGSTHFPIVPSIWFMNPLVLHHSPCGAQDRSFQGFCCQCRAHV